MCAHSLKTMENLFHGIACAVIMRAPKLIIKTDIRGLTDSLFDRYQMDFQHITYISTPCLCIVDQHKSL